jgi:hypothetical protein
MVIHGGYLNDGTFKYCTDINHEDDRLLTKDNFTGGTKFKCRVCYANSRKKYR